MSRRLLISFSAGETSAYMTWRILNFERHNWDEIVVVLANTGEEREESLIFADACDRHFGFNTVWLEGVQFPGERKAPGFRVVTFETADRTGRVFEEAIQKYGIPNAKFKHCTRVLKLQPIHAYAQSLGWEKGSYYTAIGIRADELDRMSIHAAENKLIYPLIRLGIKKPHINRWWSQQPFRLNLKGYQNNCKWCWKKSWRKHFTLISERPEIYDFPRRMEALYGGVGPEHSEMPEGYRRVFFRGSRSTDDVFALYEGVKDTFVPAEDDAAALPEPTLFDIDLDTPGGCGESCEVWSDDDIADLEEAA